MPFEIGQSKQTLSFFIQIGKVHNKLNNTHLALMHFSWAMDLDPKVANSQIKDALDPSLNRVSQEDPAGSISIDDPDPLVVEDIELRGLEHTDDDDAIMLEGLLSIYFSMFYMLKNRNIK